MRIHVPFEDFEKYVNNLVSKPLETKIEVDKKNKVITVSVYTPLLREIGLSKAYFLYCDNYEDDVIYTTYDYLDVLIKLILHDVSELALMHKKLEKNLQRLTKVEL